MHDRVTWLARLLLPASAAVLVATDGARPTLLSSSGLSGTETDALDRLLAGPDGVAFLAGERTVAVEDAVDGGDHPIGTSLGFPAYLLVPLAPGSADAAAILVLCRQPRIWTIRDVGVLVEIGERAISEIKLRSAVASLEQRLAAAHTATTSKETDASYRDIIGHDTLTGLPNRMLLYDRLRQIIARARRYDEPTAVLYVDLDDFRSINDTIGSQNGDVLLQRVAACLVEGIRESDTVARLGGDEFMIVLPRVGALENAYAVANKLIGMVASEVSYEGGSGGVAATIGMAMYPDDGGDAASLLHIAEAAFHRARARGVKVLSAGGAVPGR